MLASDDSALHHNSCLYKTSISLNSVHPIGTITRWKFLQHSTSLTRREKRLPKAIKPRSASRTTCVKMVLWHAMHAPITGIKVGESKIYSIDEYFMMFFSSLSCFHPLRGAGISVGCYDIYKYNIDCQWIDITEIDFGQYTFKVSINPEHKGSRWIFYVLNSFRANFFFLTFFQCQRWLSRITRRRAHSCILNNLPECLIAKLEDRSGNDESVSCSSPPRSVKAQKSSLHMMEKKLCGARWWKSALIKTWFTFSIFTAFPTVRKVIGWKFSLNLHFSRR